jgi:hypothetical protein
MHVVTSRDLSDATREGGNLRDYHTWLHHEYGDNPFHINHTHDEHGQIKAS